jgi:hypothetical protein
MHGLLKYPDYIEAPIDFMPSYKRYKVHNTGYFNKKN